ncbi:hypothetical protein FA13DRAFT_261103 [Coprinellus micaceus]|uniref:F-box domain-containing protein n=1 Tax=Coprinellus micaceus TaxID=71717 RepID=A0A4Y7TF47_COPMI|nr:hypothetical protein FA13DRAFT_261103 [Coprinellus micaceus]
MDPRQRDIAPLLDFIGLRSLIINVPCNIQLTSPMIYKMLTAWPYLHCLVLAPSRSLSHPPSIDHTHVLELMQKLPNLRELGIRFNASGVAGQERIAGSPSKLRILRVGRSPICSSGVITLLRSNFPHLEVLDITCEVGANDGTMFRKRWEAALEGWKLARRSS